MSMISEQINKLREAVKSYRPYVPYYVIGLLHNAADTIEALSAKQENAYYVKRNGKYDVIVSIMYNKADNKYHFVNLSKNHICACGFETTEEAIADMEQRKNNGSICDFYLIERSAEDCGGGWTICNKYNLPKEKGKYWVTYFWSNKGCVELCDFEDGKFYPSSVNHENVYAWKPCDFPKPYCEDEPKYEYES